MSRRRSEMPVALPSGLAPVMIGADQVALDQRAGRVGEQPDAGDRVGRDDVAGARRRAADRDAGRPADVHAVGAVAQGDRARNVGADQVAQDRRRRARPLDRHARAGVGRDHVAGALRACRRS